MLENRVFGQAVGGGTLTNLGVCCNTDWSVAA